MLRNCIGCEVVNSGEFTGPNKIRPDAEGDSELNVVIFFFFFFFFFEELDPHEQHPIDAAVTFFIKTLPDLMFETVNFQSH
jgi:hypothetical protein